MMFKNSRSTSQLAPSVLENTQAGLTNVQGWAMCLFSSGEDWYRYAEICKMFYYGCAVPYMPPAIDGCTYRI